MNFFILFFLWGGIYYWPEKGQQILGSRSPLIYIMQIWQKIKRGWEMKSPKVRTDLFPMQIWLPWHKDVRKIDPVLMLNKHASITCFSSDPTSQRIKERGLSISLNFQIYVPLKLILCHKRKSLSKYIDHVYEKTYICRQLTLGKDNVKLMNGTNGNDIRLLQPDTKNTRKNFVQQEPFTISA